MDEETRDIQMLENLFGDIEVRVISKKKDLDNAGQSVRALDLKLLEVKEEERASLIAERAQAVMICDAVLAEYKELKSRRDLAYLAIFECKVALAKEELDRWKEKSAQAHLSLDKVLFELRPIPGKSDGAPEWEAQRIREFRKDLFKINAEIPIIQDEINQANSRLRIAMDELVKARQELSVNRAGKP